MTTTIETRSGATVATYEDGAVTATAAEWLRAFDVTNAGMAARPAIPILAGVLITAADGVVTMTAYDYDTSASTELVGATATGNFRVLVTHKWVLDTLKTIVGKDKTQPVTLTTDGRTVSLAGYGYVIPMDEGSLPVSEYPTVPAAAATVAALVSTEWLKTSMARMMVSASTDDTLPILTSVRFELATGDPGNITLFSTDRYRLAMDVVSGTVDEEHSFLLSASTWKSMAKHLTGMFTTIRVNTEFGGRMISFESGLNTFTALGVDGDYPKLRSLFPEQVANAMRANRAQMIASATVAMKLSERNCPAVLKLTEHGVEVCATMPGGKVSKAPVAAGDWIAGAGSLETAFAPKYLLDCLKSFDTEDVVLSISNVNKPCVFSAGQLGTDPDGYRHLIMPVRMPS